LELGQVCFRVILVPPVIIPPMIHIHTHISTINDAVWPRSGRPTTLRTATQFVMDSPEGHTCVYLCWNGKGL